MSPKTKNQKPKDVPDVRDELSARKITPLAGGKILENNNNNNNNNNARAVGKRAKKTRLSKQTCERVMQRWTGAQMVTVASKIDQLPFQLFIHNNPCRLSSLNTSQYVSRCCVVCGDDRFVDATWNDYRERNFGTESINTCSKPLCNNYYDTRHWDMPSFPSNASDSWIDEARRVDSYPFASMYEAKPVMATLVSYSTKQHLALYLFNNPCRLSDSSISFISRYCIVCGIERYTDDEWSADVRIQNPQVEFLVCTKDTCSAVKAHQHFMAPRLDIKASVRDTLMLKQRDSFPLAAAALAQAYNPPSQQVTIVSKDTGKPVKLFLSDNPCRLSKDSLQFFSRFCVVCGVDRFGNNSWNRPEVSYHNLCFVCRPEDATCIKSDYLHFHMPVASETLSEAEKARLRAIDTYPLLERVTLVTDSTQ